MKHYNILIGGYDFEQKIHRGITFYGKALIKSLSNSEINLLTSAKRSLEEALYRLNILRQLNNPSYLGQKKKILKYIMFKLNTKVDVVKNDRKNYEGKLNYLNYVANFYNIPYIYDITTVHNRLFLKKPLEVNLNKNIDIFIATSPLNIVTNNTKMIQTLHDVIPLSSIYHPPADDSKIFYYRVKNMLEYSDKVISVSNYSKEECLKIFPQYEDKIVVSYQPIPIYEEEEELIKDTEIQNSILSKYKLSHDNYLFYVGMLEERKNIKNMIEAFLAVYDKIKMPLVLAGGLGHGQEEFIDYLKSKKYKKKIKYIGYINNIEKLVLLKNTRAFLFPSYEEGFGLPPLEAMKMGSAVLTSNISALPEVCGKAALYVNPFNIKELAEGIVNIVLNETLRSELFKHYEEQLNKFTYENFSLKIEEIIKSI